MSLAKRREVWQAGFETSEGSGEMDFSKVLHDAVGAVIASGKIEATINAAVEKAVLDAVQSELRTYSDFGKAVSEAVNAAVKVDRLSLPEYNAILLDALSHHVDATMRAAAADSIKNLASDLLRTPPAEIKLSELVEEYKKHLVEDRHSGAYGEHITCDVEITKSDLVGKPWRSAWISLHPTKPESSRYSSTSRYSSDVRIMVSGYEGELSVSSIWLAGAEAKAPGLFIGNGYGFERTLFQLWANKTLFVLDEGAVDTEMPEPECECA